MLQLSLVEIRDVYNSRETLLDFSNGIASFFATSVENRANLSNLGSDNLAGCKCFFL